MKLTLHIGTPKTATTTLQHTFAASRGVLLENGLFYPGPLTAHHEWRDVLDLIVAGKAKYQSKLQGMQDRLSAEVAAAGAPHILMSSESFVDADRAVLERLRDVLYRTIPGLSEIRVICYLREPIGFATSNGQQLLKAGHVRLHDIYRQPWTISLRACFENHFAVFGQGNVTARHFHPDHLTDGDIIADFLATLGLAGVSLPAALPGLNTSTSMEGALVADALSEIRPRAKRARKHRRIYKRFIEQIPGQPFVLPVEVQERVIEQSRDDLDAVNTWFGLDIRPGRIRPAPTQNLHPQTAMWMARMIERIVETCDTATQKSILL
ncbi:MAG: hypothetical protein WBB85_19145 [Albidovulum sp.]|uniref:hypothetical protein n=1 Tax=Albidovulum sp. TaxID=1872424 RepID=UPI003C9D42C6